MHSIAKLINPVATGQALMQRELYCKWGEFNSIEKPITKFLSMVFKYCMLFCTNIQIAYAVLIVKLV